MTPQPTQQQSQEWLIYSHGQWMTPEEEQRMCDEVDSCQQGDYE